MKNLILLTLLSSALTAGAQTTKQDSAHRQYHLMRRDPKQNNPYAFADSAKAKKPVRKPKKKTN